ncbi:hypothetical protein PR003_g14091 [Phytophthora rubi]|uniref:M96 mating-specific protein family n=1 Tax=Phytophthora rubi TaxID=129364 RepID=A0A6A3LKP6_9STRA|nr:hypothetical protein PR001_g14579 [Phytophthora rubi]KAE9333299.1 hypothetical protein PR003_g14091 [Phytophthora rubi]
MSSESLEEALAFLEEEMEHHSVANSGNEPMSLLGGEVWDPEALLSSIDDEIGDLDIGLGGPAAETQASVQMSEKPKRKRKKQFNSNRARDERRFEVVRLRREVEDLQLTLKQLQYIRDQQQQHVQVVQEETERTGDDAGEVPAVWQEICSRQLDRRMKAERENALLKQQWEEEKRFVKSIEKMLFKRMALRDTASPEASKHTRRTSLPAEYIKRVAAFIFDELSASVEVSYREVEGVFAADGPVPKNVVTHQPLLRGGMKGMYRRLFDKRFVPFNLQETGDAWWEHWHDYRGHSVQNATSNIVTESFGLEMNDLKSNVSATSYGQQILRRYVEQDRIVLVWNAYIEPFVFENEPVSGVYLLEQSHVLIKPEDAEDGNTNECSTSMSTCYVITPHYLNPKLKDDAKTTTLIDFLVSALSSNIKARNETVENLLLDQALHKHHHSP